MLKLKKYFFRGLHYGLMLMIGIIMLMPIGWMLGTSMRQSKNSFKLPPSFWPTEWNPNNFKQVFTVIPIVRFTLNSLFVAVISVTLMLLLTSLAAYGLTRLNFKGRDILFMIMLAGLMIPQQSISIPVFLIIRKFKLIDSLWSLVATSVYYPLGLFMMRQFMMTIPRSYDEAAICDGASRLQIYFRIILPMSKTAIIVTAVMHFINVWNNFFNAMIFINSTNKMTLPLGITLLNTTHGNSNMPLITAAVLLTLIPPLLIYIFGQKYLIQGSMTAGIKG